MLEPPVINGQEKQPQKWRKSATFQRESFILQQEFFVGAGAAPKSSRESYCNKRR
jgi:hypothetical protein